MKIIIGEPTGFCSGVRRAIAIVKKEAKKTSDSTNVYTLGPIVHNTEVVSELKKLGVKMIRPDELKAQNSKKSILVIRSHGCAPDVINRIKKLGYRIVDATCPNVRRVQNYVAQLKKGGYFIVVVGDKNHPEVKGILGYAKPFAKVYQKSSCFKINNSNFRKIGIVGQTTIPFQYFQTAINSFNSGDYDEIRIFNTLCKESLNRQKSCEKIEDKVDLMLVVGSRNSANTTSLVDVLRKNKTKVYQVGDKNELENLKLFSSKRAKFQKIGIIAGASTPQDTVFEVVKKIKNLSNRGNNTNG